MTDFAKRLLELFTAEKLAEMIERQECVFCGSTFTCAGGRLPSECAENIHSAWKAMVEEDEK
jgi:hypothetical protein